MRAFASAGFTSGRRISRRHARYRDTRRPTAAVIIGALVGALLTGSVAAPAAAANSLVPSTAFEIDGNFTGAKDWLAPYGPGTTPGGHPTTGLYHLASDTDLCASDNDDVGGNGVKLDHGPIWGSLTKLVTPSKSDLKSLWLAAEKVDVAGTFNDIVYAAYERCNADPGSMIASLFFDNGDGLLPSQGGTGDFLMLFEFNPSKDSSAKLYKYSGGGWNTQLAIPAGAVDVYASQTVGEVAINLTKLNILPAGQCRSAAVGGQAATASGYDPRSSLIDLIDIAPFTITTCGDLKVDKTANVPDDGTAFGYTVFQKDNGVTFDSALITTGVHANTTAGGQNKVLSANLEVGQQDTWRNVIASPDYTVTEDAPLPAGWSLDSIVCTYRDIFAVGYPTREVTLYADGAYKNATFSLPPSVLGSTAIPASSCTLRNEFTGITVVKAGDGDDAVDFDFTFDGDPFTLQLGDSQTFPATVGEAVTIVEGPLPEAALPWGLDAIICKDGSGATVGTVDLAKQTVTVTPGSDGLITCTFTNNERGKLVVKKASAGGTGTFDIGGTAAGQITTTADDGTPSGTPLTAIVEAGSGYSVSETAPAGWRLDAIMCDKGEDNPASITIGAGETVTCTVYNSKLGSLTLTKSVEGVADDYAWEFGFTLSPAATGGGLQTAAGVGNQTSSDVLAWTDLQPGTTYTVTESGNAGFTSTFACMDPTGTPIPDANEQTAAYDVEVLPGMALTCEVDNVAKPADVTVTKTVTGVAPTYAWSFDFTLTPAATGGGLQTASGTGPDSDELTWSDLVPGETYTLAEEVDPDYAQQLACSGIEDEDGDATDASVTFTAGLDQHVVCAATNAAQASSLTLTKSVSGVAKDYDWAFEFTLDPAAGGGGAQTASGTGNSVSDPLEWTGLIPGALYTISETSAAGWDQRVSCTGVEDLDVSKTSVTLVAGFDQAIVCTATNAAKPADLTVTKTVTGVAPTYQWGFDFTLTPAATGGGAQTASGVGPDSDVLTWTDLVPGQQYVISEETDSGYVQQLACTGIQDEDGDATDASVTFTAGLDQSIVCEATNGAKPSDLTLTKTVTGVDADYQWSFGFTLAPAATGGGLQYATGTGPDSDQLTWSDLVPGQQYVLTEMADARYVQSLGCTGVEDLDLSPTSVTFVAGFDQSLVCAARNAAKPSDLTVTKTVSGVAPDYQWSFDFTLAPAATGGGTQTASGTGDGASSPLTWSDLVPGTTYVLSEEVDSGYAQSLECTGVEDMDDAKTSVTFVAGFDQSITCEATNEARPAKLTVEKTVEGVADTYEWEFDFTLAPAATGGGTQTASGTGPGSDALTWSDLVPGVTYTLSEEVDGDYVQTLLCTGVRDLDDAPHSVTFVAQFAADVDCTALNVAKPSSLTVTKTVTGVAEGYAWSFDFTLSPEATGGGLRTASGTGPGSDPLAWSDLVPGETYTITEKLDDDYEQALTCTGVEDLNPATAAVTFVAGFDQAITCEADNDARPSSLTVTKTVTGVAPDYQWAFDFTLSPTATGGGTQTASGTGPESDELTWTDLVPGETYTITEETDADYAQTLACVGVEDLDQSAASVTFVAGFDQHVTCAAGNAAQPSTVTLTKEVTGVAEGYQWSFDFVLQPEATGGLQTASGVGDGVSEPLVWTDLVPGTTYSLIEELDHDYVPVLACTGVDDLDPAPGVVTFVAGFGQSITCAAVNEAIPSSLTLTKTVTGVADDFAWSFDFTLAPEAGGGGLQTAAGVGAAPVELTWTDLVPGETYVVAEIPVAGYTASLACTGVEDMDDAAATVTFVAGFDQAIECDAVNAAEGSTLSVVKTVVGAAPAVEWAFMFSIAPVVGDLDSQIIEGSGSGTSDAIMWTGLIPGETYLIAEAEVAAYTQLLECEGVEDLDDVASSVTFVAPLAGSVSCEATNTLIPEDEVLSETGANVAGPIGVAILLLGSGLAFVIGSRRRRA